MSVSLNEKLNGIYGENLHFKKSTLTILSFWLDLPYFSPFSRLKDAVEQFINHKSTNTGQNSLETQTLVVLVFLVASARPMPDFSGP